MTVIVFQIVSAILALVAICGYLNYRYVGLPSTIAQMAFALILSLVALGLDHAGWFDADTVKAIIAHIDFPALLLDVMLPFLLFAGALHINLRDLAEVRTPVVILATVSVVIATAVTGVLTWYAASMIGVVLPFMTALMFGALISPTDPIAVLSILRQAGASRTLYAKIGGESLFNDGVALVLFVGILRIAAQPGSMDAGDFARFLLQQAGGGLALGGLLGWVSYRALKSIDDYKTEVIMTLAVVACGTSIAELLHVSAPLAMVAAGLIVGNHGRDLGMSEVTRRNIDVFWELIDEILNALLFFVIGLELVVVPFSPMAIGLGLLATAAVLFGRFASVALPVGCIRLLKPIGYGTVRLLTWGGLRGGLSVAMALSLPDDPYKPLILTIVYVVVLFSILVQGLTFRRLVGWLGPVAPVSGAV